MTNYVLPKLAIAAPEIFMLITIVIALLGDLFYSHKYKKIAYAIIQVGLIITAALTINQWNEPTQVVFHDTYILDKLAIICKLFIYLTSFGVFLYSKNYNPDRKIPAEYYILGALAILGMMVMASASNMLSLYLGLEVLSLPLYAMIALAHESEYATESSMKYFVMGAIASGMLLYGMSMVYGATQALSFTSIATAITTLGQTNHLILVFGLVFIVAGAVFKLGAVPFHMWVPDVYHGSPSAVTLFIGSAPKIAGAVLLFRLLLQALPSLSLEWQHMLLAIAILSMGIGNLVAIAQTNLKRMLAYSSIAHMGYMVLGLIAMTTEGYSASLMYVLAYSIMSLGAFAIIVLMSRAGFEAENIDDFRGLNTRSPWLAFMMMLLMFSMAGIPPSIGFFAKLGVLQSLVNVGMTWLAVVALLFAIVGAYYYLRVIKTMYFEEPHPNMPEIAIATDARIAISINGLAVLALGLFPSQLINLCKLAF